jgi:hypothetical protein
MNEQLWRACRCFIYYWRRTIRGLKKIDALITAIATVLLAIITGALAFIAYWQYSDTTLRETLVASNRAWIAPAGLSASGEIDGDKDIGVLVFYSNLGKGPALKLNANLIAGSTPNTDKSDFESLAIGPNKTCDGLLPKSEGAVIFPNSVKDNWINTSIARKLILATVKSNESALYIQGCWAYETMHEIHHTWFCYIVYRNGTLAKPSATVACKDGHGAD